MKLVGKVREAHGLKGDLYVLIFSGDISWAKKMKSFGLKAKDSDDIKTFDVERTKPFKRASSLKPKRSPIARRLKVLNTWNSTLKTTCLCQNLVKEFT